MTRRRERVGARAALLSVAVALAVLRLARAHAAGPGVECERLRRAVEAERRIIEDARRTLSPAEANCAFADFSVPVSGECERLMEAAKADDSKRRAWSDALVAWSSLDRHMLAIRRLEDQTGTTCIPR